MSAAVCGGETQLAWRANERHRFAFEEWAMTVTTASILWRRLDVEGHDACLLSQADGAHSLEGQAIFVQDGKPCCLAYAVICDTGWRTRSARVDGILGMRELHYAIERRAHGAWMLNGEPQRGVAGLVDVDLGFTPASNLLAIRRLPGTSLADAAERAEALRKAINQLHLAHRGRTLGTITASFGVSAFPELGASWVEIVNAVDRSLYQAKADGRDRIVAGLGKADPNWDLPTASQSVA